MTIIHNAQVTLFCLAVCGVFVVIGCIVVELVVGVVGVKVEGVVGVEVVGAKVVVELGSSRRIPSPWRKIIIIGFSALYLLTK